MAAPSWLGDVLKVAIPTVGGLLSTKVQTSAAKDAAAINQKYLEDALAYEKERDRYARGVEANRYGAMMGTLAPYQASGTAANARMASLLGLPAPTGPAPMAAPSAGPAPPAQPPPSAAPAAPTPSGPQLPRGIGTSEEVDQANQFMRAQPWYQDWLHSHGQGMQAGDRIHLTGDLNDQLLAEARKRGIGISDRFEIDDSGNIREKGHALRNTLIGAGIGASMFIPGVAPAVMSGLHAAGSGLASAGHFLASNPYGQLLTSAVPTPGGGGAQNPEDSAPSAGVWMQAPDGSTQQVPADEVDHWTRLGAKRIG